MRKNVKIVLLLLGLTFVVAACALQLKTQATNPDLLVRAPDIGPGTMATAVMPAPECPACTQDFRVELVELKVIEITGFDTGKYDIVPSMAADLDEAASILKKNPGAKCAIYGHADLQGEPDYDNVALSQNRANAVQKALIQRGVKLDQIPVCGGLGAINRFGPGDQPRNRGAIIVISFPANGGSPATKSSPIEPRQFPGGVSPYDPTIGESLSPVLVQQGETIYFNIVFINALLPALRETGYPNISLSNISVSAAYDGNQWSPRRGQDQMQIDHNIGAVVPPTLYNKRFTVVIFPPGQNDQFIWTMYSDDHGCYIHNNNYRIGESSGLSIDIGQCPRKQR